MFEIKHIPNITNCGEYIIGRSDPNDDDENQYIHSDGTVHSSTFNETTKQYSGWFKYFQDARMALQAYETKNKPIELTFKVGDLVRCIAFDAGITVGNIYTVTKVSDHWMSLKNEDFVWLEGINRQLIENDPSPFYANCFELVAKPIFKPGDKIRCIESCLGLTVGNVYTVIEMDVNPVWVCLKSDNGRIDGWTANRFELVTEEEPKAFKVGDYVRCLKDYGDEFTKGKIYKLIGINPFSIEMIDDRGVENGWSPHWFELAPVPKLTYEDGWNDAMAYVKCMLFNRS